MKKLLGLAAVVAGAAAAFNAYAKKQGRGAGELAGEWVDKAKDLASDASDRVRHTADEVQDDLVDLRDDIADKAPTN